MCCLGVRDFKSGGGDGGWFEEQWGYLEGLVGGWVVRGYVNTTAYPFSNDV